MPMDALLRKQLVKLIIGGYPDEAASEAAEWHGRRPVDSACHQESSADHEISMYESTRTPTLYGTAPAGQSVAPAGVEAHAWHRVVGGSSGTSVGAASTGPG